MTTLFTSPQGLVVIAMMLLVAYFGCTILAPLVQEAVLSLPSGRPFTDHAELKHGEGATMADECQYRPAMTLHNPSTRRFADICQLRNGVWAVFVYEIEEEVKRRVTSFPKEKMKTIEQVIRNLENGGYSQNLPGVVR